MGGFFSYGGRNAEDQQIHIPVSVSQCKRAVAGWSFYNYKLPPQNKGESLSYDLGLLND
jgi:hypothetical protein